MDIINTADPRDTDQLVAALRELVRREHSIEMNCGKAIGTAYDMINVAHPELARLMVVEWLFGDRDEPATKKVIASAGMRLVIDSEEK
jgi:hypothetical protein